MVCMGNICRSPMAQEVMSALVVQQGLSSQIMMDSAGTHAHHAGEQPDPRAVSVAIRRGYAGLAHQRSRRITAEDFERFDLIIAMDRDNLANLKRLCPPEHAAKLHLFLEFAPELGRDEVPDPYYGNVAGFERVLDLCEAGARGLLNAVVDGQLLPSTRSIG